jgi:hypothetical protein
MKVAIRIFGGWVAFVVFPIVCMLAALDAVNANGDPSNLYRGMVMLGAWALSSVAGMFAYFAVFNDSE